MWVRSLGQEDPLEESMATHSSYLAWGIPMNGGAQWATVLRIAKSWAILSKNFYVPDNILCAWNMKIHITLTLKKTSSFLTKRNMQEII